MAKLKKSTRIKRENERLRARYADLPEESMEILDGLIDRAAFLRPTLDDLEEDININGTTESFSQGDQEPYQRERPVVRQYNALLKNYQTIIKQLDDVQPRDKADQLNDGFEDFIRG